MNIKFLCAALGCIGLAACGTTDFAPPVVDISGANTDLDGALKDVEKFISEYRREASTAANSKSWFDVPAVLAGIGGATAVALGANADVAIGTGAFGALAASGRTYYAPSEQADTYNDALSALMCIQQEVIGLNVRADSTEIRMLSVGKSGNVLSVDDQYRAYLTIKNAALKVENIARERLATRGSVANAESIAELVKKYQSQIDAAKEKSGNGETDKSKMTANEVALNAIMDFQVDLETLAPKLDSCALIARG
jgi:hypothetical protein